ncbi:glycosyl hydrolase family 45, partial [Colletotrichum fioriniae PJ7]
MHLTSSPLTLLLLPFLLLLSPQTNAQSTGTGTTTRYWDCCKPSCAWPGKIPTSSLAAGPVTTCDRNDNPLSDGGATRSGCDSGGGGAYMCSAQSPWAVSDDLAYGFAAVRISGGNEAQWCCACYELSFTSGAVAGKKMVVQATNTGADLGQNHFDIA